MRIEFVLLVAAPLLAALPAQAQEGAVATQISQGAYGQAESKLLSDLRIFPDRPELLINLAAIYARTGRVAEARGLYTKVLSQQDVLMDLSADKVAGSHAVATAGLKQVQAVQFSSR